MKSLLLIATLFSVGVLAQDASTCNSPDAAQEPVVNVLRTINTAEVTYAMGKNPAHRFVTVDQLLESGFIRSGSPFGTASDPVPGYNVAMIVSGDGQHYLVTVLKKDGDCREVGAMSSERGIIYLAQPIR